MSDCDGRRWRTEGDEEETGNGATLFSLFSEPLNFFSAIKRFCYDTSVRVGVLILKATLQLLLTSVFSAISRSARVR